MEPTAHFEAASTIAVVVSSNEPLLFLHADQTLIAASTSFCRTFQIDPATIPGRRLSQLGQGEWGLPTLASLLKVVAAGGTGIDAYEMDLVRPGQSSRRLVINARRLEDGDMDRTRLLMAVSDVTDARAETRQREDLVREKAILLQEIQHRVANSLQIIASVLMQSARQVQSEEARGHLQNAHFRVVSIAAVQKHLAASDTGQVELRNYFTQLCESLGASMIADPARLSIIVSADDSAVEAASSISLGLIVTELVINALKHAFPDQAKGRIGIDYRSSGKNWTLSVSDDGIGLRSGTDAPKAGLGSRIVEALTRNLGATLTVSDAHPGAVITIRHADDASVI
nr:histidine kinase dimerization/phosphoacceptor domain -containing protein [Ancylobacter lacus]